MKKQFYQLFVMSFLLATIGIFSMSTFAQSSQMSVEIPFNFNVGNEKLAAGKYEIKRVKDNIFLFRNQDGNVKVLAQTPLTVGEAKNVTAEKIIFNRYGNKYFLRQIYAYRATVGRALYESKTEKNMRKGLDKEMEAKNAKPELVEVAIKNK